MPNYTFSSKGMQRPKDPLYPRIKDGKRGSMNFIRGRAYHTGKNTLAKTKKKFPVVKGNTDMVSVQAFPLSKGVKRKMFGGTGLSKHR